MWDRKVLKARGKTAFKANYWACVLVAFILILAAGGGSGAGNYSNVRRLTQSNDSQYLFDDDYYENDYDDYFEDSLPIIDDFDDLDEIADLPFGGGNGSLGNEFFSDPFLLSIILIVFAVALIIGLALGIFLLNPLEVGCRRFFLSNSEGRGGVGEMGFAFKNNYRNIVKVQFFRGLYIFLWTMLLIVPGIIKGYEYMMVPYLLSENPDMDRRDALELSKNMMYGHKWDTFILNFSFFGWELLSSLTLGLLGIFYVNPYVYATEAELYKVLSGRVSGTDDGIYYYDDGNAGSNTANDQDVYITFEEPEVWD